MSLESPYAPFDPEERLRDRCEISVLSTPPLFEFSRASASGAEQGRFAAAVLAKNQRPLAQGTAGRLKRKSQIAERTQIVDGQLTQKHHGSLVAVLPQTALGPSRLEYLEAPGIPTADSRRVSKLRARHRAARAVVAASPRAAGEY